MTEEDYPSKKSRGAYKFEKEPLFFASFAYTGELTQRYITENINNTIINELIFPYKQADDDSKINNIIECIRIYHNKVVERKSSDAIPTGPTGEYIVITASAHANLLIEDTSKPVDIVERTRAENSILGVWIELYKHTYNGQKPTKDEIQNFIEYAKNTMLITQVQCGVSGIFENITSDATHESRELSSREIEQHTIQICMSKLVDSGIPITNNVMQLILYFIRHILRATFNLKYTDIFNTSAENDPNRDWYKQIQDIAQTDTAWSSYTDIDITTYFCKYFTCKPNDDEDENYFANYGMHVNLLGDIVLDMSIRNIMMNPDTYIQYIKTRNRHNMSNPNIAIAIKAILSLNETEKTNLAELFAIADALKLKLVLFDSGCEYYQDKKYVREHRSGKETFSTPEAFKLSEMPSVKVSKNQPPPDSQLPDSQFSQNWGGRMPRSKMAYHTRKKSRRRASRHRKRLNLNNRRRTRLKTKRRTKHRTR